MVKIDDVAKKAGVSRSTVSRVLNNQKHYIREETRKSVLAAARALGYQPNSVARSLKTKKSHCIGVITDDIDTPFLPSMLKGIEQCAFGKGYSALVCNTGSELDKQKAYLSMLTQRQVDGIIFAASFINSFSEALINSSIPVVYAYSFSPKGSTNSVLPDDFHAAKTVTEYLYELGHSRIGYINGPKDVIPSKERFKGYIQGLRNKGVEFDDELLKSGSWEDPASGYRAAKEMFSLSQPPTAIFAANDVMAAGVIDAAKEVGKAVPRDLAVVGYDDREIAKFIRPQLSTVRLPMAEIGSAAVEMVVNCLEDNETDQQSVFVPCELIIRNSCGGPKNT